MASSSSSGRCFFCMSRTADFMRGWRLRNGSTAALCIRCGSDYLNGKLCETLHNGQDGWVNCTRCSKPLHCGCVISRHLYTELDFGGVRCSECFNAYERFITSGASPSNQRYPAVSTQSAIPNEAVAESPSGAPAPAADRENVSSKIPRVDASTESHLHPQNLPSTTSNEQQFPEISRKHPLLFRVISSSEIILLFEKTITETDTDRTNARLIIPKRAAEAHFPAIREKQRLPIAMRDSTGRGWRFTYVCWRNGMTVMYVLEGLKGYMLLNQWRAGDKVTFHRIVSEGKLQIGTRKAASSDPPALAKEQSPLDKNQV